MQFVYEPIKTLIECCMADNRDKLWKLTDSLGVTPKLKSCAPMLPTAIAHTCPLESVWESHTCLCTPFSDADMRSVLVAADRMHRIQHMLQYQAGRWTFCSIVSQ